MAVMNVYVEGENKNGEKVNARAFNFSKKDDVMDILRTMKAQGMFKGWQVIEKVYNLDNMNVIREF